MTDQKGIDGKSFSTGALFDAVFHGSKEHTPTCLTHDSHRLIGYSKADGLYIAPDMDCVTGCSFIAETDEDIDTIIRLRKNWLNKQLTIPLNKYGKDFNEKLAKIGGFNEMGKGIMHYNSILMYGFQGIVDKIFPELVKKKNRYGQIELSILEENFEYRGAGVFAHKQTDFAVMLHPYLRKSLSRHNNFNLEFLDALFSYRNNKDVNIEVTIDEDFIGYTPSFLMPMEFEHVYGVPFNDDVEKIKAGPVCYMSSEQDHRYYQSLKTEYNWKWEGGEFTFEMEDVNDYSMPGALNKEYGCYYVHSQYDFENGVFKHFDGAIREYSESEMMERVDQKFTETGKDKKYTKVFRMDGKIPIQEWKNLILKFTYGLPSVYEYFGHKRPEVIQSPTEEIPSIYHYVPYKLDAGDGVRLYVTFFPSMLEKQTTRWFNSCDEVTTIKNQKQKVIEEKVKNVVRYMNSHDAQIILRNDVKYIKTGDNYVNVPIIAHSENNLQQELNKTWCCLRDFIKNETDYDVFMTYSFTLSWNMSGRIFQFGFAGNVQDLAKWMENIQYVPVDYEGFRNWLEQQSKNIHKKWEGAKSFERDKLINDDGILYFKRRNIEHDIDLTKVDEDGSLSIETDNSDLKQLIDKGLLFVCPNILDGQLVNYNWSTGDID